MTPKSAQWTLVTLTDQHDVRGALRTAAEPSTSSCQSWGEKDSHAPVGTQTRPILRISTPPQEGGMYQHLSDSAPTCGVPRTKPEVSYTSSVGTPTSLVWSGCQSTQVLHKDSAGHFSSDQTSPYLDSLHSVIIRPARPASIRCHLSFRWARCRCIPRSWRAVSMAAS